MGKKGKLWRRLVTKFALPRLFLTGSPGSRFGRSWKRYGAAVGCSRRKNFADAADSDRSRRRSTRQGITVDDLIDFTPELRQARADRYFEELSLRPVVHPLPSSMRNADGKVGTIILPHHYGRSQLAWRGAGSCGDRN